jgi:hypothetical protein
MKFLSFFLFAILLFSCSDPAENKTAQDSVADSAQHNGQATEDPFSEEPTATDSAEARGIEFGFSNSYGSMMMMLADSLPASPRFSVITSTGEISAVSFLQKHPATSEDNHRQNESNFANSGGYLFEILRSTVDRENTVIFMSPEFLAGRNYYPVKEVELTTLPNALRARVEKDKKRKIKSFRCMTEIGNGRAVYLFEFEMKRDSALAALAYVTPDKIVYDDYPAIYDEVSTWRVDDGGEFGIDYFELLAVFEKGGKIELVTDWPGAEGYATSYMRENGTRFKNLKGISRYTAPL